MTTARSAAPRGCADTGQSTVELALVLPLVAALLVAIVQIGLVARDQNLVTHAAREAARAAAVDPDPAAAVRAAERAGPLDRSRLTVEIGDRGRVGEQVAASVRYRAPIRLPLLAVVLDDITLEATASMRVER